MAGRSVRIQIGKIVHGVQMPIPERALDLIRKIFPEEPAALELLQAVFASDRYERRTALKLINASRGRAQKRWKLRCLAVLLLEHYLLRLSRENLREHKFLFDRLGIKTNTSRARKELLKQGYSRTKLKGFVAELRNRIARMDHLYTPIARPDAAGDDWADFFALINQESRLTLARYCFTPQEVASRIRDQVDVSGGIKHVRDRHRRFFNRMGERAMEDLPELEAGIIRELVRDDRIYWVSERTSSELHSLVEFPLTTAVLAIKPPGSHLEFEIKRAGVRGTRRMNIVTTRNNGTKLPLSHQMYGGSFGWLGRREAAGASLVAYIYHLVHGKRAPMCLTLGILSLRTLPHHGGEAHIIDYLTCSEVFGEGFEQMREAMRQCIKTLPCDSGVGVHEYSGPVGLTLQFLAQAAPQQALLVNTTSFRLEQVALYLSEDGPEHYFARGLCVPYTQEDARRLADELLVETLGVYRRPATTYRDYRGYVLAALAQNRSRADQNFMECMQHLGEFWGTLLGVRGYSDGESFVARNVGLRSVWEGGKWRIQMLFMDHDDLFVLGRKKRYFWPYRSILGMYRDEVHVMGRSLEGQRVQGDVGFLREIYDVDETTANAGMSALQDSIRQAYEKTLSALESRPPLQDLFFAPFIDCLRDWDNIVRIYLDSPNNGELWKARALDYLRSRSYEPQRVRNYINSIEEYRDFLDRMAFLYQSK